MHAIVSILTHTLMCTVCKWQATALISNLEIELAMLSKGSILCSALFLPVSRASTMPCLSMHSVLHLPPARLPDVSSCLCLSLKAPRCPLKPLQKCNSPGPSHPPTLPCFFSAAAASCLARFCR